MANLSDNEIRNILKSYGQDCGPLTRTTRNMYLNKVKRLQSGQADKAYIMTDNRNSSINGSNLNSSGLFDSIKFDMNKIAEDVRNKNRISNNVSPLTYSHPHVSDDPSNLKTLQTNASNVGNHWYRGSLSKISKYLHAKNNGMLDISDAELSDTESTLFTRLRKNYFKRPGIKEGTIRDVKNVNKIGFNISCFDCSYLPNILLMAFIVLILVVFGTYFTLKTRYSQSGLNIAMNQLICQNNLHTNCFSENEIRILRPYLHTLYDVLCTHAGNSLYHQNKEKRMTFQAAKENLIKELQYKKMVYISNYDWSRLMSLVISLPAKQLHIVGYDNENVILGVSSLPEDVTYLECLKPKCSLLCRLKLMAIKLLSWISIFIISLVMAVVFFMVIYGLFLYRKKFLEENDRKNSELNDILCKLSEILKDQLRHSESHPNIDPYLSLDKLRSILQQTYPKIRDNELWDKVKDYTFKHEPLIIMRENLKQGPILQWRGRPDWQGSAVHSGKQVSFERGPTECLKIRNIVVDKLDWEDYLRKELIARLSEVGVIFHMGFVKKAGNKVIAYVLCSSREVAGRAFAKINANYYNGNLLTVKFIRLEKYVQRFPVALEFIK